MESVQGMKPGRTRGAEADKKIDSVKLRGEPGWVTFSLDGKYAFPSTGEIVDVESRKVVQTLVEVY